MKAAVRSVLGLLRREDQPKVFLLAALLVLGSVLEVGGIGLILPFFRIAQQPEAILDSPQWEPWISRLGISSPESLLLLAGAGLIVFFAVKNAYLALQWYLVYSFIHRISRELEGRLLRGYLGMPYVRFLTTSVSDSIRNATHEVSRAYVGVLLAALRLGTELLVLAGLMALLFAVEPAATLTAVAALLGLGWFMLVVVKRRVRNWAELRSTADADRIDWIRRAFGGFKVIRVHGTADYFTREFDTATARFRRALRGNSLIVLYPPLVVETLAVGALAGFLVLLVLIGRDTVTLVSSLTLFGIATIRLVPSVNRIVNAVNQIRFNLPAVDTLDAVVAEMQGQTPIAGTPGPRAEPLPFRTEILIEDLSFRYPGSREAAVAGVNLRIGRGETVALVGPSGAGKTTLVDLILGLLTPDEGQVSVDGADLRHVGDRWQANIGYIPQTVYLADDTLRRNVAFGIPDDAIDDGAVWAALERVRLADLVRSMPRQLDTRLAEDGSRLSGGQRQRIGIARALYLSPDVIVLDEATASLDGATEREVTTAVREASRGKTVIVIAHRLSTIHDANRIVLMRRGRVECVDRFEPMLERSELFRSLIAQPETLRAG